MVDVRWRSWLRSLCFALPRATALAAVSACGASTPIALEQPAQEGVRDGVPRDLTGENWRCDFRGRSDREAKETAGPGAVQPNTRRVYAISGDGDDARRVLVCREVDTNYDGVKDVVRTYTASGDPAREVADSDHDGKIDTWTTFHAGRIVEVIVDTNGDGWPDETRSYSGGRVQRIQRDTNFDGEPDVWEIYDDGRLQRMGEDLDHDGLVDRWSRDADMVREAAERERAEAEGAESAASAPPAPPAPDAESAPTREPSEGGRGR